MRFTPEAVAVLLALFAVALWGGIYLYRSVQAALAATRAANQAQIEANPRIARMVRVLGDLRSTLIWIAVGLVGWIIFMYFALSRVL
jgi:hypothetical protein